MVFWITAITLAGLVFLAILLAIFGTSSTQDKSSDLQVYRDQLAELDRDLVRDLILASEHERARAEIARRILALDDQGNVSQNDSSVTSKTILAVAVGVFVVGGGALAFAKLGAVGARDLPLNARLDAIETNRQNRPSQAQAETDMPVSVDLGGVDPAYVALVEQLREKMAERQDDAQGFEVLARAESNLGNYAAAYKAMQRRIELLGDATTADEYAILAEFQVLAAGGYVSPTAETNLDKALALDSENQLARYYVGLMWAQAQRSDLAFETWQSLLTDSAPDAPWRAFIQSRLPSLAEDAGIKYSPPEPALPDATQLPGPDAQTIANAADMDEADRQEMISNMVEGLAGRLATEGGSAEEWARLIRALAILNQNDRAKAILAEGRQIFAASPESLALINSAGEALE